MGISVIISYWNGKRLAEANLPSVMAAVSRLKCSWEIIAVDDGSTDGLADMLKAQFPKIRAVIKARNEGFHAAMKCGVDASREPILYFLNSDVRVEADVFQSLLDHFDDPLVCAVSSLDAEQAAFVLPSVTQHFGLLGVRYLALPAVEKPARILFATGGHSAYRASIYKELGGYDPVFAPAYWEDIDFGVRAQSRGFKILLEPRSRVHHQPRGTMARKYSPGQIEALRASHRWWFTMRHSQSPRFAAWLALGLSHGFSACPPFSTLFRKQPKVASQAVLSQTVLKQFSPSAVKQALNQPWRVAFISATGAMAGGGEASLLTLLKGLDKRRVSATVICPEEGPLPLALRQQGIGVEIISCPSTLAGIVSGRVIALAKWLREQDMDLVHVNSAGRSLLLWGLAARIAGVPVIWHVRVATKEPLTDGLSALIANRLIITSKFVASRFNGKSFQGKIIQVANPVDIEQFALSEENQTWRKEHNVGGSTCVGVFGRFDSWKRFDLALRAFAIAQKSLPGLRLFMAGDGPERLKLEALAEELGLQESASFLGWQPQLSEIMHGMDILFHPTPKEHFGRIFIEAMASGKPVVAPRSGGAAELVVHEQTGILTEKADPQLFAQAILRLAGDPVLRAQMGKAARAQASANYSSKTIAGQIQSVYAGLFAQ